MTGCLLVVISVIIPRCSIIFIALLTDWFSIAYETVFWPVVGWFFMPYTTLAYMAVMTNNSHEITGGWVGLTVLAIVVDATRLLLNCVSE